MTSRPIFRDPDLQARFDAQGYVIVPFFDAAEVERLSLEASGLCPVDVAANCFDSWSYISSYDPPRRVAISEFVRRAMTPGIGALLTGVRIWTGVMLQRQPDAGPLTPHQHLPSTAALTDTGVLCWCPLFDSEEDGGALQVIPGSHQLLWHVVTATRVPPWQAVADELPRYLVTLRVRAGEAVLFSESLIHGSSPTRSRKARIAMVSLALPEDAIPAVHVDSIERPDQVRIYRAHDEFVHSDMARGISPPQPDDDFIGEFPANRVALNLLQFEALLANGDHIGPGRDPYLAVADMVDATPVSPFSPAASPPGRLRRFVARHLPASVKARLRSLV